LARGWLVKKEGSHAEDLAIDGQNFSTLHVLSQLLHRVGMDAGQSQTPSLIHNRDIDH